MQIHFNEANQRRLENLATQEGVLPSDILETLFERHAKAINSAVLDSNRYINFINTFGSYIQEDLGSLADIAENETDKKMYKVFEALYSHTLENQIILADLFEIYKRA